MSSGRILDFIKVQGRIALALLALLGASIASAHSFSDRGANRMPAQFSGVPNDVRARVEAGVPWVMTQTFRLPQLSVEVSRDVRKPVYRMKLPNGEVLDLPQRIPVVTKGLSHVELSMAAEDTRLALKAIAQVIEGCANCTAGIVSDDFAKAVKVDAAWAAMQGLRGFDPIQDALTENVFGRQTATQIITTRERAIGADTYRGRLALFWQFVRDAVYTSTIEAYRNHRATRAELKSRVQEWGIQFAFRAEIQIGIGKVNITKNFPLLLSFGYNREKKTLVFRRSVRSEKMAAGTAFSIGGKFEIKRYRLIADQLDAADERTGYAGVRGQSWYPPSIPIVSPVLESAPGFQSEGLAFGFNFADLIPGAYLMNTVTSFKEEQRVYSTPLPDPKLWMKQLQARVNDQSSLFGGNRGARCEVLFAPAVAH